MRTLTQRLTQVVTHPINARIAFDLVISGIGIGVFAILLTFFQITIPPWWAMVGYPTLFVLINNSFGVYSDFRYSHPLFKTVLLSFSALTLAALYFILYDRSVLLFLAVSTFFVSVGSSIPRWFFNLTNKPILQTQVKSMMEEDLPILVVGGGGYIGSHVVQRLLSEGKKVRVLDTFYYGKEALKDLESPNLEIITGDITDLFALTRAIQNVGAVVHLAGIVGDPACSLDDKLTRHLNIVTTRMLKEQAKAFRIPRFIFASSCSVYGAAESIMNEDSALNPVSLYAQTKIDAEKELFMEQIDDFHPTILRFATVFGHSRRMRFDLVVNLFTAQAYENGLITVMGSGQWRPFVHVYDIARAISLTLEAPLQTVSRQVFNVGDDRLNITIGDLANVVSGAVGKSRKRQKVQVTINDTVDDPRNYHVSFAKINRALGFEAEYTLERGILEMQQHFRNRTYQKHFTDPIYSNKEMTKLIQTEFYKPEYQRTHFSVLASQG